MTFLDVRQFVVWEKQSYIGKQSLSEAQTGERVRLTLFIEVFDNSLIIQACMMTGDLNDCLCNLPSIDYFNGVEVMLQQSC